MCLLGSTLCVLVDGSTVHVLGNDSTVLYVYYTVCVHGNGSSVCVVDNGSTVWQRLYCTRRRFYSTVCVLGKGSTVLSVY